MSKKETSKSKAIRPKRAKQKSPKPTKAALKGAKVGKGRTPENTRFPKGVSGNPSGRPKGSKNLATIIMEAAHDRVTATIDGKPRKISKLVASAMQLATKAAAGDQKSVGQFLDRVEEIEERAAAARPAQFPIGLEDLEVLREIYARMKLCEPIEEVG